MTGFANHTYDTIIFEFNIVKKINRKKVIDVIGYPLYIVKENNKLYTESEFYEFNHIEIYSKRKYENIIENYIRFIMNTKYNG